MAEALHNLVEGTSVWIAIVHDLHQFDGSTPATLEAGYGGTWRLLLGANLMIRLAQDDLDDL